jgi:hypothetical protein
MDEPMKALRKGSPLSVMGETMRAARFGLPYGRIPQSNRSMDRQTFDALERLLSFMCAHLRSDDDIPESIDEDGRKVKQWIENYKQ